MKPNLLYVSIASLFPSYRMGDLEISYDKEEDIPVGFETLYSKKGEKYELTGINGVKTQADITRLQGSLDKERKDHKATKEKWAPLADKDPNDIIALMEKVPELELLASKAGTDEEKVNQLVETRLRSKLAPVQRELENTKKQLTEISTENNTLKSEKTGNTIKSNLTRAAIDGKVVKTAMDDITMYASLFEVNEEGKVVTKDGVGTTPGMDPTVWLTEMREKRPHWFEPNVGGGAGGGNGKGPISNPFSYAGWNQTEQMKLVKSNPAKAEQYAKQAGVDIKKPVKPAAPAK